MSEIEQRYEKETGKKSWVNPVCHGEIAYASWDYQKWLESHLAESEEARKQLEKILNHEIWEGHVKKDILEKLPSEVKT